MLKTKTIGSALIMLVLGTRFGLIAEEAVGSNEIVTKLEACYQILDDANRLAAYDQLAVSLGITRAVADEPIDSDWSVFIY